MNYNHRIIMILLTLFVSGIYLCLSGIEFFLLQKHIRKSNSNSIGKASKKKGVFTISYHFIYSMCMLSFSIMYQKGMPKDTIRIILAIFIIATLLIELFYRKNFVKIKNFMKYSTDS